MTAIYILFLRTSYIDNYVKFGKKLREERPKRFVIEQSKQLIENLRLPIIYSYGIFPIIPRLGILTHIFKFYLILFNYLLL